MITEVVQKAIVFNKAGNILMLRRSKTDVRRPLQWDLPGGMLEKGEELLASIGREIKEETGVEASHLSPVYSKTEIRTWIDGKDEITNNVVFIFYTARTSSSEVSLSYEHDKFQWEILEKAVEQYKYPLHKEVLNYIISKKLLQAS